MYKQLLYDKEVLATHYVDYKGIDATVCVLDANEYYAIHILTDIYKKEELNTLYLEESKEYITLEKITDDLYLECIGLQFLMWHKWYGYQGQAYSFNVDIVEAWGV